MVMTRANNLFKVKSWFDEIISIKSSELEATQIPISSPQVKRKGRQEYLSGEVTQLSAENPKSRTWKAEIIWSCHD